MGMATTESSGETSEEGPSFPPSLRGGSIARDRVMTTSHVFDRAPRRVYWEVTRACNLACRHCRAEAAPAADPAELTPEQGQRLLHALARFGRPLPHLVLTGGDPLKRADLFSLIETARALGFRGLGGAERHAAADRRGHQAAQGGGSGGDLAEPRRRGRRPPRRLPRSAGLLRPHAGGGARVRGRRPAVSDQHARERGDARRASRHPSPRRRPRRAPLEPQSFWPFAGCPRSRKVFGYFPSPQTLNEPKSFHRG